MGLIDAAFPGLQPSRHRLAEIRLKLRARLALGDATRQGRNLGPITAFFGNVDHSLQFHKRMLFHPAWVVIRQNRPPTAVRSSLGTKNRAPGDFTTEGTENTEPSRNIYGLLPRPPCSLRPPWLKFFHPPSNPSTRLIHAPVPAIILDPPAIPPFSPVRLPCRISPGRGMRINLVG